MARIPFAFYVIYARMFEFRIREKWDAVFVRVHSSKAKYITEKGKSQTAIPTMILLLLRAASAHGA